MGDILTKDDRVRFRRNHAYVVDTCFNTTMMIARAAGASSLFESNPIQRFVRDVHAGSMQAAAHWDEPAEAYGRVRMGLEPHSARWCGSSAGSTYPVLESASPGPSAECRGYDSRIHVRLMS